MAPYKEGDKVKVLTKDEQFEGILMPRPDILEKGFIVVKLDSGYNIGIDEKKIKNIELVEQYKPKEKKKEKITINKKLPTVSVISTGGTIASRVDYRTGGVYADYTAEDYVEMMPSLKDIANIRAKKVMSIMTEDIQPEDWKQMAKEIKKELDSDVDGVVVTMGTDMLHYISAALSFFLKDLNKPVVITAAQRSIDRGSSDAYMNLACAITAAKSEIAEVITCMHGTTNDDYCILIRGVKVRKMHTSRRDAFRPVNDLPLAKVFENGKIEFLTKDYNKSSDKKTSLDDSFEEKTALIQVYPGMDPEIIDFYANKGYKGIVLAATALGHVPTNNKKSIIPNLKKAIDKGIAIIIASQTLYGRVHPYVYTNLRKLSIETGCIFVEDMIPETAYIKLGWILGHTKDKQKIKEMMLTNYKGEITDRSLNNTFLV